MVANLDIDPKCRSCKYSIASTQKQCSQITHRGWCAFAHHLPSLSKEVASGCIRGSSKALVSVSCASTKSTANRMELSTSAEFEENAREKRKWIQEEHLKQNQKEKSVRKNAVARDWPRLAGQRVGPRHLLGCEQKFQETVEQSEHLRVAQERRWLWVQNHKGCTRLISMTTDMQKLWCKGESRPPYRPFSN